MDTNQPPQVAAGSKKSIIWILVVILVVIIVAAGAFYFLKARNGNTTGETVPTSISASPSVASSLVPSGSIEQSHCLKNPTKSTQITVSTPADYSEVSGDNLVITGTANAFESLFDYRIKDCNDAILASGFIQAEGEMGQNALYTKTLTFQKKSTSDIIIELYEQSAADGSEIHLTQVPLRLK